MIPFTFELMGRTVTVRLKDKEYFEDLNAVGHWNPDTHVISISDELPEEGQQQAFYHEFMHAAFDSLGQHKLSSDEKLVDQMGSLILQMLKTRGNVAS